MESTERPLPKDSEQISNITSSAKRKRVTFHQEGLRYVASKVRGSIEHGKFPLRHHANLPLAFRYAQHCLPDVVVFRRRKDWPDEMHEVEELRIKGLALREYAGASPKTVLWVLSQGPLRAAFDDIKNVYRDQDGYLHSERLCRGRKAYL